MSIWNFLDGGRSTPGRPKNWRESLLYWIGRRFAKRHANVYLPSTCWVHPGAKIHPRTGVIQLGENCIIAEGAIIQGNVTLGDNCSVQSYTIMVGYGTGDNPSGQIKVGDGVRIASHCMLIAANHVFADSSRSIHEQGMEYSPITIEDDVWIGGRVSLTAGVTIGSGSVVGAGSVVTKSIPSMSIAVGVPARVVRNRGMDTLRRI